MKKLALLSICFRFLCSPAIAGEGVLSSAKACYEQGRYDECLKYLSRISDQTLDQTQFSTLYYRGLCYLGKERYIEGIEVFERIRSRSRNTPESTGALFHLGRCYFEISDYLSSYGNFFEFVAEAKNNPLVPEAEYYRCACLFREDVRRYSGERKRTEFRESVTQTLGKVRRLQAQYQRDTVKERLDRLAGEMQEMLTEKATEEKGGIHAYLLKQTKTVLKSYPDGEDTLLLEKGMAEVKLRRHREAGGYFLALIKKYPESPLVATARYRMGLMYGDFKAYREGIEEFKKMIEMDPKHENSDDALYLAGYYYLCLEDYEQARETFETFLKAYPDSPRAQWAQKDMEMLKERDKGKDVK